MIDPRKKNSCIQYLKKLMNNDCKIFKTNQQELLKLFTAIDTLGFKLKKTESFVAKGNIHTVELLTYINNYGVRISLIINDTYVILKEGIKNERK